MGTVLLVALGGLVGGLLRFGGGREEAYGAPGPRYRPAVTSRSGVVVSASADASAAGVRVLEEGGNAVDAAVATVFAIGVTAQESCGIGGGGFLLYRGADGTVAALDFRETAPAGLAPGFESTPRRFPGTGHQVVGVPGTVAGMAAAAERYGSRPFARLLDPAIALAERGVRLTPRQVELLAGTRNRLDLYEASRALYLDKGAVPAPYPQGRERPQRDLAGTLRTLQAQGPDAFYRGPIAAAIVAEMERSRRAAVPEGERGVMTAADLESYRPVWREALHGRYRGRDVLAVPPPTAGGIVVLEMLNLLEGFDLPGGRFGDFRPGSANHLHLLAEAKKIAVADRNAYVGDPAFVAVPTGLLVSKSYAEGQRAGIDLDRAADHLPGEFAGYTARPPGAGGSGPSTHHISVVDAAGNAVSVTCTVEQRYGSAVVVPGTGILLNNELTDFDGPGSANEPAPGKRPRSNMSPVIVVEDGRPALVLGAPGGPRIPMGVLSVVVNVLDFRMDPALAVDVARVDTERCCTIELEGARVPSRDQRELERRGHRIEGRGDYHPLGVPLVQVAGIGPDGRRFGASDPRSDRGAVAADSQR